MEAVSQSNIEFQVPGGDQSERNHGRRDYRIDASNRTDFFLRLRGNSFPVLDACSSGVRIRIEAETVLDLDELIPDCELRLGQDIFAGLRGRVIHCTLTEEHGWIAGVEWIDVNVQLAIAMTELMERLRREFFNND